MSAGSARTPAKIGVTLIVTVLLAHFILREKIRERLVGVVIMVGGAWLLFLQ